MKKIKLLAILLLATFCFSACWLDDLFPTEPETVEETTEEETTEEEQTWEDTWILCQYKGVDVETGLRKFVLEDFYKTDFPYKEIYLNELWWITTSQMYQYKVYVGEDMSKDFVFGYYDVNTANIQKGDEYITVIVMAGTELIDNNLYVYNPVYNSIKPYGGQMEECESLVRYIKN